MAFDNVTFFELHFDGARFGPQFGGDDDESEYEESEYEESVGEERDEMDAEVAETAADSSGRRGRFVPVLAVLALVGVAAFVARRRSRRGMDEEMADVSVDIEHVDADPIEQ